jgi:endoglycosylceramidase
VRRPLRSVALLAALVAGFVSVLIAASDVDVTPAGSTARTVSRLPTLRAPLFTGANVSGSPAVSGPIRSPGGPYLYDSAGRIVFFHGVNAVNKHTPYELYPAPGKPWNLSAADASLMARLGFNVVRLGMTWRGLEPGTAPANDPSICSPGPAHDPGQYNQAVLDTYVNHLRRTVAVLGQFHIYTILDMHQDVYNEMFDGEGAPNWAVCTDGVPSVDPPGRWSREYGTAAAGIAYEHFWSNDVQGNLQGEFDRVWAQVASAFRGNPWVLGYDPFNEPFSKSLVRFGDEQFDAKLECFYTGTAHVGTASHGAPAIRCPQSDPAQGVVGSILNADPRHLVFVEPDNFASRGLPTYLGPMEFPNLVYNVHIYCGSRSPVTGNPINLLLCAYQDGRSLDRRAEDRTELASRAQPNGPAWMVTEFGASSDPGLLNTITATMDAHEVGWAYWAWKYYGDPTGSADESLVMADGRLRSTARVLSRAYPEAVAGIPVSFSFSPASGAFELTYVPDHRVRAPTVVFVPTQVHYPHGYCARVSGARITSAEGSDLLLVHNRRTGHRVTVRIRPGDCRDRPRT